MDSRIKAAIYIGLKYWKRSQFFTYYRWLQQNQYQPFEMLCHYQERFLRQLLQEAYDFVPAYRDRLENAGVFANGKLDLANFAQIPPLTREDIVFHGTDFTHLKGKERGMYLFKTGGSTATPIQVVQDNHYWDWYLAANFFTNSWSGLRIGTPYFLLWSAYRDLHAQLHSWKDQFLVGFLQGRRILNCRVSSPDVFTSFIQTINQQTDCHYLVGYAAELYALACHSQEQNLPINRPFNAIYSTAENLTQQMRETIESVFQCPVYNRYGCREAGDLACECDHQNGLHINPLCNYVEVVDDEGKPLPYGEEGRILVTNLHNYAMPLIRYAIGDEGCLGSPQRCQCGREWQTLAKITGRTSEKLYLFNGKRFGGSFLHTAFDHLPLLQRYQIHQFDFDKLFIKLRSSEPDYVQKFQQDLVETARRLDVWSGQHFQIQYEQTHDFERTPTGKELIIIHHFNTFQSLPDAIPVGVAG